MENDAAGRVVDWQASVTGDRGGMVSCVKLAVSWGGNPDQHTTMSPSLLSEK